MISKAYNQLSFKEKSELCDDLHENFKRFLDEIRMFKQDILNDALKIYDRKRAMRGGYIVPSLLRCSVSGDGFEFKADEFNRIMIYEAMYSRKTIPADETQDAPITSNKYKIYIDKEEVSEFFALYKELLNSHVQSGNKIDTRLVQMLGKMIDARDLYIEA